VSASDGIHCQFRLETRALADGYFDIVKDNGLVLDLYEYLVA